MLAGQVSSYHRVITDHLLDGFKAVIQFTGIQLDSLSRSFCSVETAEYDCLSCAWHSRGQKTNSFKQLAILRLKPIKQQSGFEGKCEVALVSMPAAYAF